jgi:hypothetical protein
MDIDVVVFTPSAPIWHIQGHALHLYIISDSTVPWLGPISPIGCQGTQKVTGGTTTRHDAGDGRRDDGKGQQGDRRNNNGNGRQDDGDGWRAARRQLQLWVIGCQKRVEVEVIWWRHLSSTKSLPYLTSAHPRAAKGPEPIPHASWVSGCTVSAMISLCSGPNRRGD